MISITEIKPISYELFTSYKPLPISYKPRLIKLYF